MYHVKTIKKSGILMLGNDLSQNLCLINEFIDRLRIDVLVS